MISPHENNADRLRPTAPIHPPENRRGYLAGQDQLNVEVDKHRVQVRLEIGFLTLPEPSWTPPFHQHTLARCPILLHWWQEQGKIALRSNGTRDLTSHTLQTQDVSTPSARSYVTPAECFHPVCHKQSDHESIMSLQNCKTRQGGEVLPHTHEQTHAFA